MMKNTHQLLIHGTEIEIELKLKNRNITHHFNSSLLVSIALHGFLIHCNLKTYKN